MGSHLSYDTDTVYKLYLLSLSLSVDYLLYTKQCNMANISKDFLIFTDSQTSPFMINSFMKMKRKESLVHDIILLL